MKKQEITNYDNAKYWISQYESVDDVKDYMDKAAAIEAYAKRANDMDMEVKAAKARIRAERRLGEILSQAEKAKASGSNQYKKVERSELSTAPKTLEDMKISRDLASEAQQLASVPEKEFEKAIEKNAARPTTRGVLIQTGVIKHKEPKLNEQSIYLCGELLRFEKKFLHQDKQKLINEMLDTDLVEYKRVLPLIIKWLKK